VAAFFILRINFIQTGACMDNLIQDIMANPPKVASFDFDDTLSFGVFKVPNSDEWFESYQVTDRRMSPIIKDIIQKLYQAGTAIYMVTSRKDTVKNRIEVTEFLKENSVLNIFKELIFVGNDKAHKLQEIGSELHFDDDNHEFKYLKQEYPNTKTEFIQIQHTLIPGEISGQEGNWTMQKLGLLAKFLK
jgi:acid phosphatase class B